MRMPTSALALTAAICLPLSAASAQDATASDNADTDAAALEKEEEDEEAILAQIIVEGERRLKPKEIGKAVDSLTRRTGLFAPVSRFQTPVCVRVIGLGEPFDGHIASRIRQNVEALGLQIDAKDKCSPNAITIIADDPQATFDAIRSKRTWLIGWDQSVREYSLITLKAQLREKEPAVSWSIYDGSMQNNGAMLAGQPQAGGFWGWNGAQMPAMGGLTRGMAVVLVDAKRINGMRVHQLADFATVHLLGSPRAAANPGEAGVPTILSLFDGDPKRAPQRLTTFDRAYLCGLYRIRQRGTNPAVNLAINSRMKQNMLDVYDSDCVRVGAPASETDEGADG